MFIHTIIYYEILRSTADEIAEHSILTNMNKELEKLVRIMVHGKTLKTVRIIEAFRIMDRKDFVPNEYEKESYNDYPLPIGYEQTISQPSTVAFMLELLNPRMGERILDVGSGSGWTTALIAHLVGNTGAVWGVEKIPELVIFGKENISTYNFSHAHIEQAGEKLGLSQHAPFDKILVSAESDKIPDELMAQLKIGGVMVIPVKDTVYKIIKISEKEKRIEKFEGFIFVPLKY